MYLDAHQDNWIWNSLYINSQNVCSVPHISSFLIWDTWHNRKNVIASHGVYSLPHKFPFLIWRMRDIYHDTYHRKFNCISFILHPEVTIIDHYSSCIELSTSNDSVFVISMGNINHLSINEFILVVLMKYKFPNFHIIVKIKCVYNYFILNGFWL